MRCDKCGKENPGNVNFCKYCGNPLHKNLAELIERAKQNDQGALEEIYRYSSSGVYRVIKVLVKDEDTVNDLLQDTYVKAFTRLEQLQDPERLLPWLKMIANNTAKDWLKKSKPVFFSEISSEETEEDFSFEERLENVDRSVVPELAADEKEVRRLLMEILDQLPEDQRVVIGMYYYEEMSVRDIAAALEVSENTVKSRLVYGRKKIKEQVLDLEKRGTKLYTAAPFVFFLYLLQRMQSGPVTSEEASVLQQAMEPAVHSVSGTAAENPAGNINKASSDSEAAGSQVSQDISGKAVKSAAAKASGKAAKHIGIKIASLVIAGAAGAGGITYGVLTNYDKLPFTQSKTAEDSEKTEKTDSENAEDKKQMSEPTAVPETQEEQKTVEPTAEPTAEPVNEEEIYRTFCDNYVKTENLQVISDGYTTNYDQNVGYTNDLLLGTFIKDFGGDGRQELLLVRTRSKAKDEHSSNYTDLQRVWYLELYGIDGEEVHARQYEELPDGDLNSYLEEITEQIGIKEDSGFSELYRYGKYVPGSEAALYKNTFIKVTDTELVQENDMSYMFGATYGECKINGNDFYTGNADADIVNIQNVLQQYGMEPWQELTVPLIVNFKRAGNDAAGYSQQDTFQVQNEFAPAVQADQKQPENNDTTADDQLSEGLQMIQGEWYTFGGDPYHLKIVFSGNTVKAYLPESSETYYERTVRDVIKTDYGYFVVIAYDYGDYGYRLETQNPGTLTLVGTSDPYSEEGFSGTDSLVRQK